MAVILIRRSTIGGTYDGTGTKVGALPIRGRYASLDEALSQIDHERSMLPDGGELDVDRVEDEDGRVLWTP